MVAQKKSKKRQKSMQRQKRSTMRGRATAYASDVSLPNILLFLGFFIASILICFVGLSPAGPLVQQDQTSRIRITAEIDFSYVSEIETAKNREELRQKIPPVFFLNSKPYTNYASYINQLILDLEDFLRVPESTSENLSPVRATEIDVFLGQYPPGNPYNLRSADIAVFINQIKGDRRKSITDEAMVLLGEIISKGIYSSDTILSSSLSSRFSMFQVQDENGVINEVAIQSEEDALRALRINIAALDIPREATVALFRIFRTGLQPNLQFDEKRSTELIDEASKSIDDVRFSVEAGQSIIEPNSRVTALQYEQLQEYRKALREGQTHQLGLNALLLERVLLTFLITLSAAFYLKIAKFEFQNNFRVFALSCGLILFNLILIRLALEMADSVVAEYNPIILKLIPFLAPIIIGPVLITILVGSRPGILAAGLISVMNALMQGNNLSILVISFLVCLVGIFYCRNIQLRASLVRAGLISGLVLALGAGFAGFRDNLSIITILYQLIASIGNGLVSGMLIVGLIPILEQLFRYTTDITLLELTDFNHPLLRKMQVEAPGSYHHSIMVANLSENAAAGVGANPLVCRVCALFHDIGKLVKPDHFTENQRDGRNPHIEHNPSMSALVIKSHVKEGVQLAKEYKLPEIIIDVIRQHHGTSLIQYFYYKAIEKQRAGVPENGHQSTSSIELDKVNESTYRYEGPIPQFTESAIIMLADSIEAASRSLRKVTPQSVDELLDKIFQSRLDDGQLDNTPLTFSQLQIIKKSFAFTLLNMLHARVEYPDSKKSEE